MRFRSALSAACLASAGLALGWLDWQVASLPVAIPSVAARLATAESAPTSSATPWVETAVPEFTDFLVIAERPLFSPGRRAGQNEPPSLESNQAPQAFPQWLLSGVMLRGDAALALIRSDIDQPASWVRQDDEVSGWRIVRIDSDGVLLRSGNDERLVELYAERATEAAQPQ